MSESNLQEEDIRRIVQDETQGKGEEPAPTIADPAPLGLAAFSLTTFVLSAVNAGFFGTIGVFVPLALFYGGLVQVLAGMFEFRNKNTFGATAFGSYGAFWIALGFLVLFEQRLGITEETLAGALGLTLLGWTIFTFYMWIGSFSINTALVVVFTLLLATFAILTVAEFSGIAIIGIIGGYVGLATAFAAWYTSAAGVINSTAGRVVLPVGPRG